jgi:hypothetical protein
MRWSRPCPSMGWMFVAVPDAGRVVRAGQRFDDCCQGRSKSGPLAPVEKCPTLSGSGKRLRAERRCVAPSGARSRLRVAVSRAGFRGDRISWFPLFILGDDTLLATWDNALNSAARATGQLIANDIG